MLLLLLAPTCCLAGRGPADEANRLIQQQQQRFMQARQWLQRQPLPDKTPLQNDTQTPTTRAKSACFTVNAIELKGATLLKADTPHYKTLLAGFQGRCVGIADINHLLRAVTDYYFDRGYITSRVYVPEQNLSTGSLQLSVIEGKIEAVRLEGQPLRHEVATALPGGKPGKLLNLRDLEQAVDQLNRLPSNRARLQLHPGEKPGASRVVIRNQPQRRYHVSLALDNSGQESTGRLQRKLRYQHDNLFGLNDLLSIGLQQDNHSAGQRRKSRSADFYFDIPYGYWNFELSGRYFDYDSTFKNFATRFQTSGSSRALQLGTRWVAHRNAVSKTTLGLSLIRKDNRNFLEDVRLESSSQVLTIGHLSVHHLRHLLGGRFSTELAWRRGLTWWGAQEDEPHAGWPRAQYDAASLQLAFQRPFVFAGGPTLYSANLFYQYSEDKLFGSEQVSIGGEYTVNGFRDDSFSGSSGGYLRQEISRQIVQDLRYDLAPWLQALEWRLGLDAGQVKTDTALGREPLYSAWAGIRSAGDLRLSLIYAKPFNAPAAIRHRSEEWYFSISFNF